MTTQTLTRASRELFRRAADERFATLDALLAHCRREKDESLDRWHPPKALVPTEVGGRLGLTAGADGPFALNDWSFGQLCGLARVGKETVNRLTPETAARVFQETLPGGGKPLQLFTRGQAVRSVHGTAYIRRHVAALVRKRDERRDGFVRVVRKAMEQTLGPDAEEVMKVLVKQGLTRGLAKQAVEAVSGGRFTLFALVDALTRLAQKAEYAGDRTALDVQAAALFALAA